MMDIMTYGELLIDYTYYGKSPLGNTLFEQNPGGAPANLAILAKNMGFEVGFMGKVGNDIQGLILRNTLSSANICIANLIVDDKTPTPLAFVHLDDNGERQFSFFRSNTADTQLNFDDFDVSSIHQCKILHLGSLPLTHEPSRTTTFKLAQFAKKHNVLVSFDPNYRESIWDHSNLARKITISLLKHVDLLKLSIDELFFLSQENNIHIAIRKIHSYGPKLIGITLGKEGALLSTTSFQCSLPSYPANVVDTTGAGDSFWGGILTSFLHKNVPIQALTPDELTDMLNNANCIASLCIEHRGGIPSMPTLEMVKTRLKKYR